MTREAYPRFPREVRFHVIVPEHDGIVKEVHQRMVHEYIQERVDQEVTWDVIPGAGHMVHIEKPDEIVERVKLIVSS